MMIVVIVYVIIIIMWALYILSHWERLYIISKKVKQSKVRKVRFTLEQATKAQKASRGT
jgi:hypothetical protein